MPRLAICSRDLYWHWINWALLCDTMEVSMLHLAWLTIAQHVFQPALTGRLELLSRKIVSCEREQRLWRWADFVKNCLPQIGSKELLRFRKNSRSWAPCLQILRKWVGVQPWYIQFRDIHDCDISGVHCDKNPFSRKEILYIETGPWLLVSPVYQQPWCWTM